MNNQRSKTFIKIKHSIQTSVLAEHLQSCRNMIDNGVGILSNDEVVILKEYIESAQVTPHYEDELESFFHRLKCGAHYPNEIVDSQLFNIGLKNTYINK